MKNLKKVLILFILALCFSLAVPNIFNNSGMNHVEAATIKLNSKKLTLYKGQSYNLSLKNSTKKVTWSSKNNRRNSL